jgi:hypothetical protein
MSALAQAAWLNLKDAKAYSGLSIRTLERRAAEGAFETSLRGVRLINRESLDAWIRDGVGAPARNPGKGGAR